MIFRRCHCQSSKMPGVRRGPDSNGDIFFGGVVARVRPRATAGALGRGAWGADFTRGRGAQGAGLRPTCAPAKPGAHGGLRCEGGWGGGGWGIRVESSSRWAGLAAGAEASMPPHGVRGVSRWRMSGTPGRSRRGRVAEEGGPGGGVVTVGPPCSHQPNLNVTGGPCDLGGRVLPIP